MIISRIPSRNELILRGVISLAIGIVLLAWTNATLTVLVTLVAILVFADAALKLIRLFQKDREGSAFALVLGIVINVAFGILILAYPDLALKTLLVIIGVWAILSGVIELVGAWGLRGTIAAPALAILGFVSLIIGIVLVTNPGLGIAVVVIIVGIYALLSGATLLVLAFFGPDLTEVAGAE